MWMSDVAMNVWMRGRSECLIAFQAASMSCADVRARPQITGPSTAFAIAVTASKSPGEVIGKPASMMSTPRRASWCAISSFSCTFSEMPGDCSPSRSVVSKMNTRSTCLPFVVLGPAEGVIVLPPSPGLRLFLLRCAGLGPRLAYSPRRGRRRRRRPSERRRSELLRVGPALRERAFIAIDATTRVRAPKASAEQRLDQRRHLARHARARHDEVEPGLLRPPLRVDVDVGVEAESRHARRRGRRRGRRRRGPRSADRRPRRLPPGLHQLDVMSGCAQRGVDLRGEEQVRRDCRRSAPRRA